MYEQERAPPVVDTTAALADGATGIELIGNVERAITANLDTLEAWMYGEAGHQAETPQQEREQGLDALPPGGWCKPKALPQKCKRKVDVLPQGSLNEGKHGRGYKVL